MLQPGILKWIKRVTALGLVLALFLPLSHCVITPPPGKKEAAPIVMEHYAVYESKSPLVGYLPGLFLLLPGILLLVELAARSRRGVQGFLQLLAGTLSLLVVASHAFIAKLLLGGYLVLFCALGFLLAVLVELVLLFLNRKGGAGG